MVFTDNRILRYNNILLKNNMKEQLTVFRGLLNRNSFGTVTLTK